MERAPFAFAFFRGSCGPRLSVKRDGALFYCIAAGEQAVIMMCRLLMWYLAERLVNVPTRLFVRLHTMLISRVTRTLSEVRVADAKRERM